MMLGEKLDLNISYHRGVLYLEEDSTYEQFDHNSEGTFMGYVGPVGLVLSDRRVYGRVRAHVVVVSHASLTTTSTHLRATAPYGHTVPWTRSPHSIW